MKKILFGILGIVLACLMGLDLLAADWVPGELLIKHKPGVSSVQLANYNKTMGITSVRILEAGQNDWSVIKFNPLDDVAEKAKEYIKSGLVLYAEPNYIYYADPITVFENEEDLDEMVTAAATNIPNDPAFKDNDDCYSFKVTDAVSAWSNITDASNIIVAVVDTGIRYTHEDIKDNMWTDKNGRYGISIRNGEKKYDCYPEDVTTEYHGTHVAGTIGATGNNGKGTAGVTWKVKLMGCKTMWGRGGYSSDIVEGMAYARLNGAKIINLSLGGPGRCSLFEEEIIEDRKAGILVICAAGNEDTDNDLYPNCPSGYCIEYDNVISVGASNARDERSVGEDWSADSNYGKTTVNLFAPGELIFSTVSHSDAKYGWLSGTSMATPFVAGAAALCWAKYPNENYLQIKNRILNSVDKLSSLNNLCSTGGRININKMINSVNFDSISISGGDSVDVGSTVTYTCKANYSDGNSKNVTPTWSISSGTSYASINSSGVLTGIAAGSVTIKASYTENGVMKTATKSVTVNEGISYHPADTNKDQMIKIMEVTNYGKAWKNGETWPVAPNPISISYLTRAGALWKGGEFYRYDKTQEPPLCWVNSSSKSMQAEAFVFNGEVESAASSPAYCEIKGEKVTITVTPGASVSAYAVEDMIPSGWTVTGINESGIFDSVNHKVKWGPWFDDSPRTLTYTLVVPSSFTGTATLSGTVSFDGVDTAISGNRQYGKSASSGKAVSKISGNQVTITVTPETAVSSYALEDNIPSGLSVTGINESGVFDSANRKVKWGPWFDNSPRTLTYTLLPGSFTGTATLNGTVSFDGVNEAITGDRQYTPSSGAKPIITTQPQSQTTNEGESVMFSVVANGGNADFSTPISNTVNLDMVWIKPGTFMMGSPIGEIGRGMYVNTDETRHKVTLTKGYWLGKYEVTQAQYKAIMRENPSGFIDDNNPVENVSWFDATNFCAKLTAIEKAAGRLPAGYEYTLPTEAQWEYACRAGTTSAFNNGTDIPTWDQVGEVLCPNLEPLAWYYYDRGTNDRGSSHPVGQKEPNAWGLYDMHGNVWEWCLDWYADYPTTAVTDPTGPSTGSVRIRRGGSWFYAAALCRSAHRSAVVPEANTDRFLGFRVALVLVNPAAAQPVDNNLTYQWYKDGKAISGATSPSYKISSVKNSDAGRYTVTVSNSVGSVTSSAAVLTVNTMVKPSIIHQPMSQTINEGNFVEFTVVANDGFVENKDFSTLLSGDVYDVSLDMVWIQPGAFMMGSPENEVGRGAYLGTDETQHEVKLTSGYWLGKYEVTQAQYEAIMGSNPSGFIVDNNPVENVSWYDAMNFCAKLTAIEKAAGRLPTGYEYTLPTEAQWEYACRAGTTSAFNNGTNIPTWDQVGEVLCPNLETLAWYYYDRETPQYDGRGTSHPVGQKEPNAWGLYDMHGNVWEWCLDWYADYPTTTVTDPTGPSTGSVRIRRGGSWFYAAALCRSAHRSAVVPEANTDRFLGFRVALVLVDPSAAQPIVNSLTYQWYKDGKAISGATSSSYKINSVKKSDAGKYTVTVSNSAGSVTSAAALTVEAMSANAVKPIIIDQPESQTVNEGGSVTFSVTTSETGTLRYQWKKDGVEIISVDPASSSYTICNVAASDAGSYTVTVSNEFGSVTSKAATLTVDGTKPTINFVVEGDGTSLILNFVGTLYESDDAVNWRIVEGAKAPFKVDTSKGKKFYRCAQ